MTLILLSLSLLGCHRDKGGGWDATDRQPGQRTALTAACDDNDDQGCLLPWPSSRFLAEDASRTTGLRVAVDRASLTVDEDVGLLGAADGFSRITGIATGFPARIDAGTLDGALRLIVAQPDDPEYGADIPLYTEVVQGGGSLAPSDLAIGRPRRPMPADAEMVGLVLDSLGTTDGSAIEPSGDTQLALGLVEPESQDEAALQAWFAPTRALLDQAGVDPAHVLRVWAFVTRSADDPTIRLRAIEAADEDALASGAVSAVVDSVEKGDDTGIALIVRGHLDGLPAFTDDGGQLVLDDAGLPLATGATRTAPFRVVIPSGEGSYPVSMYGHGTGGNVEDDSFDEETAAAGIAKVGVQFDGWTDDTVFTTFGHIATSALEGTSASTAGLVDSVANVHAILLALDGPLGDALSADTVGGKDNPAAGRRPDTSEPLWMGGSLGGTMGAVVLSSDARIRYAVLNVPGGGWTHFIPPSATYDMLAGIFDATYGDERASALALLMTQTAWDDADAAAWPPPDAGDMALLQESVGDPILPNIGSEILAGTFDAVLLQPAIYDIDTLSSGTAVTSGMALEEFEVPASESDLGKHGFAARDTPAGAAAMGQIFDFLSSALDGDPEIHHADACTADNADGTCDYSQSW